MEIITDARAMQAWSDSERRAERRVALVPTMGALHEGHLELIRVARTHADRVVVSIFVNPMQFNRRDDFERYPRTLDDDAALCAATGVDVIYAPSPGAMYPEGFASGVEVTGLSEPLCGRTRPGHFRGVTTVVTKLFNAVRPHCAAFGEKDWQQLAIVRRMAADLDTGIEIVGVPTVRETDGLALSSRNRLLTSDARRAAVCVPRALAAAAAAVAGGETSARSVADRAAAVIASEPQARLEYAEVRDPHSLTELEEVRGPAMLAMAVWVGGVRLIDNCILNPEGTDR